MSRKIIELPNKFHFSTNYSVLFTDINSANHMGADRVLPIALETQMRFIKSLGYDDTIVFEDSGLIMVHSEIQYISETHFADQLTVDLAVVNMAGKKLDFVYRIYNNNRQQETARLKVNMLFFNYTSQSVTQVPEGFKARLSNII